MQTLNQASVDIMFAGVSLTNTSHQADNKGLELVWSTPAKTWIEATKSLVVVDIFEIFQDL